MGDSSNSHGSNLDQIIRVWNAFVETPMGEALCRMFNQTAGRFLSMIMLPSLAERLRHEIRHLSDQKAEVLMEVQIGNLRSERLRASTRTWLEEVGKVADDATEFQESFERIGGFSLVSRCKLSGNVDKLLKDVRRLQEQKENLVILGDTMPDHVEPQEILQRRIYDMEDNLSKIRRMLGDDNCPIIGIYGMGGIGKTTLLKKINNELYETESDRFDIVIFVSVSNNVNIWNIQEVIGNRLGYSDDRRRPLPADTNERKDKILESLRHKKFLLLLDNIWNKLELNEIGIPLSNPSNNGSKIIFTTRLIEVCSKMGADQNIVEVRKLSEESSWELFCEKSGKIRIEDWTPSTKSVAEEVVKECGGLPLALITMGSAMATVKTYDDWDGALKALKLMAQELPNMEDEVLIPLKCSYDRLKDKRHKECLLYCALYPEDFNIETEELIEYWVGEGFLEDEGDTMDIVRIRGRAAINTLKHACLLEDGDTKELSNRVKLHDMIHKMASWITSGKCEHESTIFLSKPMEHLTTVPTPQKWLHAKRISLSFNKIEEIPKIGHCHELQTLLLNYNYPLKQINSGFFEFMPQLTVLDLSGTSLCNLPPDIGSLHELRFLDLSWNHLLQSMPMEVWGLKRLKMLNINYTGLKTLPREAISLFSSLQSLKVNRIDMQWRGGWNDRDNERIEDEVFLKDLDGLHHLEELDLEVTIGCQDDLVHLRNSCSLRKVLTSFRLTFMDIELFDFVEDFRTPNKLRCLIIEHCSHLKQLIFPANQATEIQSLYLRTIPTEIIRWKDGNSILKETPTGATFKNLLEITFSTLELKEITWAGKLPRLEKLFLHDCNRMVEMITIEAEISHSLFPALRMLFITNMQNLESICNQPLLFPKLVYISIKQCSMLKKLPLQHSSGKSLKLIEGDETWWNGLEWEDSCIESKFSAIFHSQTEDRMKPHWDTYPDTEKDCEYHRAKSLGWR